MVAEMDHARGSCKAQSPSDRTKPSTPIFLASIHALVLGVDIVNFHYAYPDAVTLNYGINKAIAYDETGFLGRDDDAYRRQAWNFMLSGGSIFDALDYSFSPGHEDGQDLEPNGPGGGSRTFRHQLKILRRLPG